MPPKGRRAKSRKRAPSEPPVCQHTTIQVSPSAHATEVGYNRPDASRLEKDQGLNDGQYEDKPHTFPAPLVLPGDELALDPTYSPQSALRWLQGRHWTPMTSRRTTIYVAAPPSFATEVAFAEHWSMAMPPYVSDTYLKLPRQRLDINIVADYIRAFYRPVEVKFLPPSAFQFVSWSRSNTEKLKATSPPSSAAPNPAHPLIGLRTSTQVLGIRARPTPSYAYPHQLNLSDLLDTAIASLPDDACALLMLVDQDLYEDEDDEFVCGRAFGGSRVAVVSSARYNPALDESIGLDLAHVWPLSHCKAFIDGFLASGSRKKQRKTARKDTVFSDSKDTGAKASPLQAAVAVVDQFRTANPVQDVNGMWLSRILRTAAHELGHCFGMDHCVYYACMMQGSASILEDHRQPPYLCPIDLVKLLKATGASERQHLISLGEFCQKYTSESEGVVQRKMEMIVALDAWVAARLDEVVGAKKDNRDADVISIASS